MFQGWNRPISCISPRKLFNFYQHESSHFQTEKQVSSEFARRVDAGIEYARARRAFEGVEEPVAQPEVVDESPKKQRVAAVDDFMSHLTTGWNFTPAKPPITEQDNPAVWSWIQENPIPTGKISICSNWRDELPQVAEFVSTIFTP